MGYFPVRYDSRVVNYERRGFIRLATGRYHGPDPVVHLLLLKVLQRQLLCASVRVNVINKFQKSLTPLL